MPLVVIVTVALRRGRHDRGAVTGQGASAHRASGVVVVQEKELGVQNVDLALKTLHGFEQLRHVLVLGFALRLELSQLVFGTTQDRDLAGLGKRGAVRAVAMLGFLVVVGESDL